MDITIEDFELHCYVIYSWTVVVSIKNTQLTPSKIHSGKQAEAEAVLPTRSPTVVVKPLQRTTIRVNQTKHAQITSTKLNITLR